MQTLKTQKTFWIILCVAVFCSCSGFGKVKAAQNFNDIETYNVVWDNPSKDSSGSMPIGNGDIGLNLWVEENGDILFYISKTDSWSDNCRLLKLGRVRLKLSPNPFGKGGRFCQTLKLRQGEIEIIADSLEKQVTLRVWVDAHRPVIHVEAKGKKSFDFQCNLEVWRNQTRRLKGDEANSARALTGNDDYPIIVYPDVVLPAQNNRIVWYHRNEKSCYPVTLKNQHLDRLLAKHRDPLLNRTFGGCMKGDGLKAIDKQILKSAKPGKRFVVSIYPLTAQTKTIDTWLSLLEKQVAAIDAIDLRTARAAHRQWWERFWKRSWIYVGGSKDAEIVTLGYNLQRWINACGGRGAYPIKFNGSIFTVDAKVGKEHLDGDYRRWGGMFWWQNTRLPYWSMLAAGDFDLMQPLFTMYIKALGLCRDKTRIYYNHKGAFFPETMHFWGTNGNCDFGWGHKGPETVNQYIRREWQGGIELTAMMLDYYAITQDRKFLRDMLLPLAHETITFFDRHWPRDEQGKIRFEPSQSLETWWQCVNPLPEVAGLRFVLSALLELPDELINTSQRKSWKKTLTDLPAVPIKEDKGKQLLLPAEKFNEKRNQENPELYAIFPYRLFGIGKPNMEIGIETYQQRVHKGTGGWYQTPVQAAYLGLTEDASKFVTQNFSTKHKGSRFPAFWGPNYDWIPDQDHGCVTMTALQRMLMQTDGRKIYLLPAWPDNWDVDFKLHAPFKTIVQGTVRKGRIEKLHVTPENRRKDIIILSGKSEANR
jgi:hypothetical protein